MSSVKSWMVGLVAGMAACGSIGAFAQNEPTLVIGKHSQAVQTPTTMPSGMVYQAMGAQTAKLSVYTDGFLFCGNIGQGPTGTELALGHENQSPQLNPDHAWAPQSSFVNGFSYTGGSLVVNPSLALSTLVCHSFTEGGSVVSGLAEGIFDNGYDSSKEANYNHLVNWNPPVGFDWNAPDWSQVPAGACDSIAYEEAKAPEDLGCAALTGIRANTVRAPTMWTASNGTTFTYVFRMDARFGAPPAGVQAVLDVPVLNSIDEISGSPASMQMLIRDAYDGTFLSATGTYCAFINLPQTLDSTVCAGAGVAAQPLTGFLNIPFSVGSQLPALVAQSFYVAVNRTVVGGPSTATTPAVAASLFVDPAILPEGADKFSGDDVVFGFMPTSNGFPWMSGQ